MRAGVRPVRALGWAAAGLTVACALPAAAAGTAGPSLPPFDCIGPLAPETSHAALVARYGKRDVVFRTVPAPEGETERATVIFPDDPARRIQIVWQDERRRRRPDTITIGTAFSTWRTPEGIGLGTPLEEVERLNGRPFAFMGFGWDYAGTVTDWEGGALERKRCRLVVRFSPALDAPADGLDGDQTLRSNAGAVRAARPNVYDLVIEFR